VGQMLESGPALLQGLVSRVSPVCLFIGQVDGPESHKTGGEGRTNVSQCAVRS
jgi:hypothetical protein